MRIKNNYNRIKYYLKTQGLKKTIKKIFEKIKNKLLKRTNLKIEKSQYELWIQNNEPSEEQLEKQREHKFEIEPKISIVVPMFKTPERFFEELVESLINQTYGNWELCLADGSPNENKNIKSIIKKDSRIKYKFLNDNKGISGNTNEAIKMATGDFIALLDHDDLLPVFSLYEVVKTINENSEVEFIYTDEDKIEGEKENRKDPYFKPDFGIDTLRATNYITHLSIFKKELMDKLDGFRDKYNGAQDYDIILRASEMTKNIVHIPKILYHWRVHPESTAMVADAKTYAFEAGQVAIADHLERVGLKAKVDAGGEIPGIYKVNYEVIGNPRVSILIPNKDGILYLKKCINSILKKTTYKNYEIVVIENNSEDKKTFEYYKTIEKLGNVRVINYPEKEFNYSKIINFGVKNCDSEFVMQLNNATEVITKNWLEQFIGYAQREDIGAVGARLYYEDKSIQHAGIVVGIGGISANMFCGLPKGIHGYFGKDCLTQNITAVTGACLFSRRAIYEEVDFMDEENFAVSFNDVDFCLKIVEKGKKIVYNPYIELMYHESKSRDEDTPVKKERIERECNNFKSKWKSFIEKGDSCYNKNLSLNSTNYDIRTDKVE